VRGAHFFNIERVRYQIISHRQYMPWHDNNSSSPLVSFSFLYRILVPGTHEMSRIGSSTCDDPLRWVDGSSPWTLFYMADFGIANVSLNAISMGGK
jgi:hypothetical protein